MIKKILTIVGARPQFIKAATISRIIHQNYAGHLQEVIVHTGQHYDTNMSDIFFEEMHIPAPAHRLKSGGKTHGAMTGELLIELECLMQQEKPDMVLVYGDTNSTLAGALSASKLHIPIAHVEAGMRAFNKSIPEEINRILTDHISTYFFCTTEEPANNLREEGLREHIHVVGDVMYDAVLFYQQSMRPSKLVTAIGTDFYLATIHRQENTDDPGKLRQIMDALSVLSEEKKVVCPLHPRARKYLEQHSISIPQSILSLDPVGYFDMLYLLEHAALVLTDSGGLQKEAYYFHKPVVVMRDQTEWKELVNSGVALVTGADSTKIQAAAQALKQVRVFPKELYGDGKAAERIVKVLV